MSKRPVHFQHYADYSKKRSNKIFAENVKTIISDVLIKSSAQICFNVAKNIPNTDVGDEICQHTVESLQSNVSTTCSQCDGCPHGDGGFVNGDDIDEWSDVESCDSSDLGSQETDEDSILKEDLYKGSSMKLAEFLLCLASLKVHLGLSIANFTQILKFIEIILPKPNHCPTSYYKFKTFFDNFKQEKFKKHFYCLDCNYLPDNTDYDVNHDESIEQEEIIKEYNPCNCNINEKSKYFLEIPIIFQLNSFFKRSGFYNKIKNSKKLSSNNEQKYNDFYSGSIYKTLQRNNNKTSSTEISLMWYTDGVQIFRSSKFSIWAFILVILDLPYEERYKLENILLVGLWFDEKKPQPNVFLEPLLKPLKNLYRGIEIFVKDLNTSIILRGLIMCGTCDLPAKALFLSMNQYNGRFGCQLCTEEGKTVSHTRVYPYYNYSHLRCEEDTLIHAQQAFEIQKTVCGVKGPSIISKIAHKFITSTAVDVMHCVFEGIVKKLGELWFEPKFSNEKFCVSAVVEVIDSKLKLIKPPVFIARRPRSIKDHFKYWKASELKNWCFYYSIPILENVLPAEYFEHYKCLVLAVYILCQEEISNEQIELAETLIHEFLSRFEDLYSLRYMTCNVHNLMHLPITVRRLGPLWTTSCMPLEDINGKIKKLIYSSKNPQLQIINNLNMHVNLYILKDEWLAKDSVAFNFQKQLEHPKKRLKLTKLDNNISMIGIASRLNHNEAQNIILRNNLQGRNIFCFKKLYKNKILYTSEMQQQINKKTESYFVKYNDEFNVQAGIIRYFIRVTDCNCNQICNCIGEQYAIIKHLSSTNPFSVNAENGSLYFISKCSTTDSALKLINVRNLKHVCFHISTEYDNICYIIDPVNLLEYE